MLLSRARLGFLGRNEILFPAILIFCAFLGGMVCGALALHTMHASQLEELRQFLDGFIRGVENLPSGSETSGFYEWFQILGMQLPFLGILWFLGLTVVGVPLIVFAVGARGFILGFTIGFLVEERSLQGLLLALVAVLPQNLCYVPALLIGGSIALYFSLSLLKGYREGPVFKSLLLYSMLFVIVLLVTLAGTWIEAYFVPGLTRLMLSLT